MKKMLIWVVAAVLLWTVWLSSVSASPNDAAINAFFEKKVDSICTSTKFTKLFTIQKKIDLFVEKGHNSQYHWLFVGFKEYVDAVLPGCYDKRVADRVSNKPVDLMFTSISAFEASDDNWGLHNSGFYRTFYSFSFDETNGTPKNPVIQINNLEDNGCLLGALFTTSFAEVYVSADNGKKWKRSPFEDGQWGRVNYGKACPVVTNVKYVLAWDLTKPRNSEASTSRYQVSLHMGTKKRLDKTVCVEAIYSADNAQYIEEEICEKKNSTGNFINN